jgi:hypothetical protein
MRLINFIGCVELKDALREEVAGLFGAITCPAYSEGKTLWLPLDRAWGN